MSSHTLGSVEACVDALIDRVGPRLHVATPLGIGKPNPLLNALYKRACRDTRLDLHIYTALTLQPPRARNELERRLLEPIGARLFGDYPGLAYERARCAGALPPNVRVSEFYLQAGKYLHDSGVQRDYICSNYTHVARDLLARGVNVVLQGVAKGDVHGRPRLSLSCNPDVALDLLRGLREQRAAGRTVALAAQVNGALPLLYGEALVEPDVFDWVVDDPAQHHQLFALPKPEVDPADYLIGLYASSLVRDGGELQIGIGALGDAVTYALLLRHQANDAYSDALRALRVPERCGAGCDAIGGARPFQVGLFGSSEMFVDGFMHLFEAGVLRREVYDDLAIARVRNGGQLCDDVEAAWLDALLAERAIHPVLTRDDLAYLQHFGILRRELRYADGEVWTPDGRHMPADLADAEARALLCEHLGDRLEGGAVVHAAFVLGTQELYHWLRELPEARRRLIDMRSVRRINHMYGHEELDRLHRKHARFINTTMKMSLLGAASSDTLPDGNVVSGVGGQYNFVAMAHELPEGRSVLQLRSTRTHAGRLESNLVWSSDQATIPRHLRDLVVTEYGCADLRSKTDEECIIALLNLADSRFQADLMRQAKRAGKLREGYQIPTLYRSNLPASYEQPLAELRAQGLFPEYPFGCDLTSDERTLKSALERLQASLEGPRAALAKLGRAALTRETLPKADQRRLLARMQLAQPQGPREWLYQRLVLAALALPPSC